jgi:hypothetical protein
VLTIIGTLVGVLIGFAGNYFIQRQLRSWQREQWALESRKAEWRELLSTLCDCVNKCGLCLRPDAPGDTRTIEEGREREYSESNGLAHKTIGDRIFIAEKVREQGAIAQWESIVHANTVDGFWTNWNQLHAALVRAALNDLKIK